MRISFVENIFFQVDFRNNAISTYAFRYLCYVLEGCTFAIFKKILTVYVDDKYNLKIVFESKNYKKPNAKNRIFYFII